jgi:hypothetical protein
MKRWTNGLPGATKRLGAMMAQRGLSVSQPRMRADNRMVLRGSHRTTRFVLRGRWQTALKPRMDCCDALEADLGDIGGTNVYTDLPFGEVCIRRR